MHAHCAHHKKSMRCGRIQAVLMCQPIFFYISLLRCIYIPHQQVSCHSNSDNTYFFVQFLACFCFWFGFYCCIITVIISSNGVLTSNHQCTIKRNNFEMCHTNDQYVIKMRSYVHVMYRFMIKRDTKIKFIVIVFSCCV